MKEIPAWKFWLAFSMTFTVGVAYAAHDCDVRLAEYLSVSSSQAQFEAGKALMNDHCSDGALTMWKKAAEAGSGEALFMLGIMYQSSDEGTVNSRLRKAFPYFVKAAELGNVDAMYMLGIFYEAGPKFMKKDIPLAWAWYLKAAEKGHVLAIERVIKVYQQGDLGQSASLERVNFWRSRLSISKDK